MVDYVFTFVAGTAIGVALEKFIFAKMEEGNVQSRTEALRVCFGDPMCTTKLTFTEVKEWIQVRKDQLVNGAKAAVVKVEENTMKSLGKDFDTRGLKNYIVLLIMSVDKQIEESLLVKYEKLDQKLEDALSKGNGILVVKE